MIQYLLFTLKENVRLLLYYIENKSLGFLLIIVKEFIENSFTFKSYQRTKFKLHQNYL